MRSASARELKLAQRSYLDTEEQRDTSDDCDARQCWICFCAAPGLIAPCKCTGSMQWVHRQCLDRWRVDATNQRNFTHCRHCDAAFQFELKRPPTQDEEQMRERRRRFVRRTLGHFTKTAIGLQIGLMLLAMLIREIDQKERLVSFFHLRQIEGTPPAGMGDYWNALLHHKSTYYLAALLATLFFVGATGVAGFCRRLCSCHGRQTGSTDPCFCPQQSALDNYFAMRDAENCCECTQDCSYFCSRTCTCAGSECPACEFPSQCGECNPCNQCSMPEGGGDQGGCLAICLGAIVIVVVACILVGLIIAFMAMVAWCHKVITRYMQLSQLRLLTQEYVVKDLSGTEDVKQPRFFGATSKIPSAPPQQQDLSIASNVDVESQAMHPALQRSLLMDLQAVYGVAPEVQ